MAQAQKRHASDPDRWKNIEVAIRMTTANDIADWIVLVAFATTQQALAAATRWKGGSDRAFAGLTATVANLSIDSFENMKRYAHVSRAPGLLQFFNLFPGPGDKASLWAGWQDALPYFFDYGEVPSSFPLVALDPEQKLLLVNYAHFDSAKHFFRDVCFDPDFMDLLRECYVDRGFHLPLPFFCKIVPV